ncbi:MAG: endonuclease/exonuclease/phosphatase family protein [Clostridia bacterium]|nr:endonuclease/exonuclease/phosphatase family protein [Clostridia bacterium]
MSKLLKYLCLSLALLMLLGTLTACKGADGANGADGITPKLQINPETNLWEVSYDNGATWQSLGVAATGAVGANGTNGVNGTNGITPKLRINPATNVWEASYDNGTTWESLGVPAVGESGEPGNTPQLQINAESNMWEVSYDDGETWESLGVAATGAPGAPGANGITPKVRINTVTDMWEVSYDNGATWQSLGVPATGGSSTSTVKTQNVLSIKSTDLTVMSFNIRYETTENSEEKQWDNRSAAVYSFLNGCDASIVCMQEVTKNQQADLQENISEKYGLIWYGRTTGTTGEGLTIAYDKSVWRLLEQECFWLSETPDVPSSGWGASKYRICVTALLEHIETGAKMKVFNTHLDHAAELARVNGIKLVLERMAECPYPMYLCGDFNCEPTSEAYAVTANALQDAQVTALDSDVGSTFTAWGANTDEDAYVIDYCFFSKGNIVPLTFDICDGKWGENNEYFLSDHNPLLVTLRMIYEIKESYPDKTTHGMDAEMDPA